MQNTLVAFFSATGVTKKVAEEISSTISADLLEIKPKQAYTTEDLDWTNKQSRSSIEMQDSKSRPEIEIADTNFDNYTNIIIGFPIWWYTAPTIVNTFIEKFDLSNKNIALFATSGSSGMGDILNKFKEKYPNANWVDAKLLNDISASSAWCKKLNF